MNLGAERAKILGIPELWKEDGMELSANHWGSKLKNFQESFGIFALNSKKLGIKIPLQQINRGI